MPRDIPVVNGKLLITFDNDYCMRDIFFPHVRRENHTDGHKFRLVMGSGLISCILTPNKIAFGSILKKKYLLLHISMVFFLIQFSLYWISQFVISFYSLLPFVNGLYTLNLKLMMSPSFTS
jgi:hypothetical protein